VRTDAGGRIESRPMKGTALRDADPVRDAELAEELRSSDKDRAENLMIVDLLRNDISRIAKVGSVKVPALFAVESYATVHQMVSRVVGEMVEAPSMAGLMPALFPCGSITGAPKIRAMQIIRTLTLSGGDITLNVGGGVVYDSTATGEWEEAHWKARYLTGLATRG
jgi:para-aminobenzoate synthetase component 1